MFDRFASQVEIDGDDIEYVLDGRVLKRSDTCQEVGITITSFVQASKVDHLDLSAKTQLLTAAVPVRWAELTNPTETLSQKLLIVNLINVY